MCFCFHIDGCAVIYWCAACCDVDVCVCVDGSISGIGTEVGLLSDVFLCGENYG